MLIADSKKNLILIIMALLIGACASERPKVGESKKNAPETEVAVVQIHEDAELKENITPFAKADQRVHQRHEMDNKRQQTAQKAYRPTAFAGMQHLHSAPIIAPPMPQILDREHYSEHMQNAIKLVYEDPVSTFSIDVDTASYSNVRRILNQGNFPRQDAVRIEELLNYFDYDYPAPGADKAFNVITEVGPSPWAKGKHLLHIGIQGQDLSKDSQPPANLVFLVDVSGSMQSEDKIGLLKNAFKLLTPQLRKQDSVAIVVYAGAAGAVLLPTSGDQRFTIDNALDNLQAGGSTNGGAGIHLAYQLARQNLRPDGINRVILATDGDFNVGTVNQHALQNLTERERQSGIGLTVMGFGSGNYNDALMQALAQNGNGNAYYIDSLSEARKVLVDELSSTLYTIAQDVKIQVEFNAEQVAEYRLIGYETRHLNREDFNNDKVDAGEIGAGHTVTALYEITLVSSPSTSIDPLRYKRTAVTDANHSNELAFLRLRYKAPGESKSQLTQTPIARSIIHASLEQTSECFRFAAAVSGFGEILKGGKYAGEVTLKDVIGLAQTAKGEDPYGYRGEFLSIARLADALSARHSQRQSSSEEQPRTGTRNSARNGALTSTFNSTVSSH